jgi:hypothetical protein
VGSALGSYAGYQSVLALLASSITGFIWRFGGSKIPFLVTGTVTLFLFVYFIAMPLPVKLADAKE